MNKILLILLVAFSFSCQAQWFGLNRNYESIGAICADLSVDSYTYLTKLTTSPETQPDGFYWKNDGTSYYVVGIAQDSVRQYDLSTEWDISSATFIASTSVNDGGTQPYSVTISDDGTDMYVGNLIDDKVHQYDLSTGWDITSTSYVGVSTITITNPFDIKISSDGAIMWAITGTDLKEYSLSTPYDITTLTDNSTALSISGQDATPYGFCFCETGYALYVVGTTTNRTFEYRMTTPWDISTATYTGNSFLTSGGAAGSNPRDIYFSPNKENFYKLDTGTDAVERWSID